MQSNIENTMCNFSYFPVRQWNNRFCSRSWYYLHQFPIPIRKLKPRLKLLKQ